ncbi:MAG: 2-dehydro-3-deoxyphosphogluconate aldolase [Blastopirellula sp.]|nr:MAG: 2-dehydro-3-deoxyphosphogluconate aldolase [Blastopirellula sp.]
MDKQQVLARIENTGIVAVLRADDGKILVDVAEALLAGGIDTLEVTFTVPKAHKVLETVADQLGDRIVLGAGTVLDSETARIAMLSGAQYIVSPAVNLGVIEICQRYSKAIMPGALTPTEVITAWQAGADIVKVFPSDLTGPSYLKALKAPLPQVKLMPTGGVNLETAADFIQAGACCLGIGGSLVEKSALQANDMQRIQDLAAQYVKIVKETRNNCS